MKLVKDTFPDMKPWEGPDKKEKSEKEQRENGSLGHQSHRADFSTETNTGRGEAMVGGYTISNNDANEMAYDTDLDKVTTRNTRNISSNVAAGNGLTINSTNGDNLIAGSKLAAGNDLNINSINGTTIITSAKDESFYASSIVDQDYNKISLKYDRGRGSINSESKVDEKDFKTTSVTQVSSQLVSGNNININTKDDISILSSNLNSNNQINLLSSHGNVNILANDNSIHNEQEMRQGTMELSVGLNNVVLDAAYAVDDTVKAAENLKKAKENLSKMKDLKKEGKATSDAVEDAEINLSIATLNLTLATMKAAAADKAKSTWETFGFYVDAKLTRSGDKTNINSNSTDEIASSLLANNTILINSGSSLTSTQAKDQDKGNTNIKGSIISDNGNITIISKGDTDIEASKSTSSSNMKSEGFTQTMTLGASYGQSSAQTVMESLMAQLSVRSSKSNADNVNYSNTILSAENGNLIINSFDDATIKGADLLAENITLNTGNNLNIESLQNKDHSKSKSTSVGAGGGQNSVSLSYNASRSNFDRDWVDDQTSIIGTNSITINTQNNTDIKGAVVANISNATKDDITKQGQAAKDAQKNWVDEGNLTLNTKTLTFQDIIDTEKQESSSIGVNLTIRTNSGSNKESNNIKTTANSNNPGQDANYYPKGSANLALQDNSYEREQITKATIGNGNITTGSDLVLNFDVNGNLLNKTGRTTLASDSAAIQNLNRDVTKTQEITKDTITAALNVNTTLDLRLFDLSGKGQKEIAKEVKYLPTFYGNALFGIGGATSDDAIAITPVWASRIIDENNNEIKDGKFDDHPAPNLWPGNPFDPNDEPSVGFADQTCRDNYLSCGIWISDKAPHLQGLFYGVPGFKSFSQFHDSATTNADGSEKGGAYKFFQSFLTYQLTTTALLARS